ncbi:MAG: CPBP family intramembrane metalloprotease [Candidatus Omnitrophica bacterium]|nr:CPBP family intramembrane metalloprotease [Candidatus Omnitrophota bacterium]
MRRFLGFLRQERMYILLLIFVLLMTAVVMMPGEDRARSANAEKSERQRQELFVKEQEVREILDTNRDLAIIVGMVSLLFLLLICLGLVVDAMLIFSKLVGNRLEISTFRPRMIRWGLWDVCRVVILFLFFGYIILIIEASLSRIFPLLKDDNFRMILNSSILDILAVFFIFYFTVGQYKEKISSLGLSLKNFSRNVFYGLVGYIAIIPVLVGLLVVIAFISNLLKYVPEKQAVVELFLKEESAPFLVYTSLFAAIAGPVVEELFFRGFMYNAVKKYIGIFGATLISAATFAALHAHAVGFFPILALGMLLAYLYEKTGTLVSSITVHMIHNLSMVGMVFLVKQMGVY